MWIFAWSIISILKKFVFLWAKYAIGINEKYEGANAVRGRYSRLFNKSNPNLATSQQIIFNEQPREYYQAIYLCGISANGYRKKINYPHNLHAPLLPMPGKKEEYCFEGWRLIVENAVFMPIPSISDLPKKYRNYPENLQHCRIFRWAACFFNP